MWSLVHLYGSTYDTVLLLRCRRPSSKGVLEVGGCCLDTNGAAGLASPASFTFSGLRKLGIPFLGSLR